MFAGIIETRDGLASLVMEEGTAACITYQKAVESLIDTPSKHNTSTQFSTNVGPPSTTSAQHLNKHWVDVLCLLGVVFVTRV